MTNSILTPYEITLTVRGMKHSIVQVMADYEGKIAEGIREATKKYLDNFDFEAITKQEVESTLRGLIQQIIHNEVWQAVNERATKEAQKIIDNIIKSDGHKFPPE